MERGAEPTAEDAYEPDHRSEPKKGGWLSLFGGRPRYEAPPAARAPAPRGPAHRVAAQHGGAAAQAVAPSHDEAPEASEDLDIPSFLRRLAN